VQPVTTPVISARGVSKRFMSHSSKATQLKERVVKGRGGATTEFWALHDVNIEIGDGETVGLIGPNGAGKSTLLKLLAGILRPTFGSVEVQGRIASLLELGAGFNSELTGRENVYLNAALLGLSKREVDSMLDSIIEFSEQAPRIDDPVKHYSSGEYVKLAFSIAVHVDPDVLLIDEVLAVGDEAFARKCLGKISQYQQAGKTILLVTHSLDLVSELCTRGIVVEHGRVQYDGDPAFAVGTLRKILGTDRPRGEPVASTEIGGVVVHSATVSASPGGPALGRFSAGDTLHLRLDCEVLAGATVYPGRVNVVFMGAGDIPVFSLRTGPGEDLPARPGRYAVDFTLAVPPLNGAFIVGVQVDHAESGLPITARRFDAAIWVESGTLPGLLSVQATAHTSGADSSRRVRA